MFRSLFYFGIVAATYNVALASETSTVPQLDTHYYSSQIFWLIVTFAILYSVVSYYAKKIRQHKSRRTQYISVNLEKSSRLNIEIQKIKAEIDRNNQEIENQRLLANQEISSIESAERSEYEEYLFKLKTDLNKEHLLNLNRLKAEQNELLEEDSKTVAQATFDLLGINYKDHAKEVERYISTKSNQRKWNIKQ